jgi:hypothetical protein
MSPARRACATPRPRTSARCPLTAPRIAAPGAKPSHCAAAAPRQRRSRRCIRSRRAARGRSKRHAGREVAVRRRWRDRCP